MDFPAPKIFSDSQKVYIDSWKVCEEVQKDPSQYYICFLVSLIRKMFWRVNKHNQNDQNVIIHPFGKSTKKRFYNSRKAYIDSWKVYTKEQKDPQPRIHLFGNNNVKSNSQSQQNMIWFSLNRKCFRK